MSRGRLGSRRVGAQPCDEALHADRRVQQYGLLTEDGRQRGGAGLGAVRPGRDIELGVAGSRPRGTGLSATSRGTAEP